MKTVSARSYLMVVGWSTLIQVSVIVSTSMLFIDGVVGSLVNNRTHLTSNSGRSFARALAAAIIVAAAIIIVVATCPWLHSTSSLRMSSAANTHAQGERWKCG